MLRRLIDAVGITAFMVGILVFLPLLFAVPGRIGAALLIVFFAALFLLP